MFLFFALTHANAQQPQIPTLQVCNLTKIEGKAAVKIDSRAGTTHSGVFKVAIEVKCDPSGIQKMGRHIRATETDRRQCLRPTSRTCHLEKTLS